MNAEHPGLRPGRLFCFGLGYSARFLAAALTGSGWSVAGTSRSPAAATGDITLYGFDRGAPIENAEAALAGTTHVLVSVPPDRDGDPVLDTHGDDLRRHARDLQWIGYLSTTGVYGDRDGAWVDESDPPRPQAERSKRRLAAEHAWLDLQSRHGLPVHIFRLAGIYGPGRSQLDGVRQGKAKRIVKPGHRFGRIHVADIAGVLLASMARPHAGAIYNVCDDEPAPPAEVTAFACGLLGVEPPPEVPFEAADLSPMALSFWADNRLVRNELIKRDLGYRLQYPTYREGLRAVLAAETD